MNHRPILLDREYILRYAGAPVQMLYEGVENAANILNSQYIEVRMKKMEMLQL